MSPLAERGVMIEKIRSDYFVVNLLIGVSCKYKIYKVKTCSGRRCFRNPILSPDQSLTTMRRSTHNECICSPQPTAPHRGFRKQRRPCTVFTLQPLYLQGTPTNRFTTKWSEIFFDTPTPRPARQLVDFAVGDKQWIL